MTNSRRDDEAQTLAVQQALDGRMPILSTERIYDTFGSFLWTCTAFSAATWAFLVGGSLPTVGNTVVGIVGYFCGLILGLVPVVLSSGLPSFRYGVDPVDASKAAFGLNGAVLPLTGALATLMGWTYVVMALTARGVVSLVRAAEGASAPNEALAVIVAVLALILVWLIARRGPGLFQRLSQYVAPGQMLVTAIILGLLIYRFRWSVLWSSNIASDQMLTHDHMLGFAYAIEFGISNALTWWPIMGGLTRLVKKRRLLMGPSVIGIGVLGAAVISSVSAIAAARAHTPDPTVWLLALGGPIVGSVLLGFFLAANVITMVILIYLAAVSVQQIRILARIPWDLLLTLLLAPGIYFAFHTAWMLEVVINWQVYNGVMFVAITGITLVDYFILRRQRLAVRHLFTKSASGDYWYWGGTNWVAVLVTVAATGFYLYLYDPSSFKVASSFRFLGAGIPTMLLAGVAYYLLAHLFLWRIGKGGYGPRGTERSVDAVDEGSGIKVSL